MQNTGNALFKLNNLVPAYGKIRQCEGEVATTSSIAYLLSDSAALIFHAVAGRHPLAEMDVRSTGTF